MKLRQKVIVLAIGPLIVALCAIALFVRQQAAELVGQVSSFLTVTLPALEMAQAQGGAGKNSG